MNWRRPFFLLIIALCSVCSDGLAQIDDIKRLKALSIEDLMQLEVTSVTRGRKRMVEAPSAVQVITREDILRSGATSLPEALRLASNLQVAQLNSSAWIISARGFNTVFANKLLVLIDGRTVYTPLFAGVLWELQNVLLEDVERIEVISGPGASLWGANAVNGVINVITRKASDTEGLYAFIAGGTYLRTQGAIRYGARLSDKASLRVFNQYSQRGTSFQPNERRYPDNWWVNHAGARLDIRQSDRDFITIQGDFVKGRQRVDSIPLPFDNENIIARWTHISSERSEYTLQFYWDRYYRDDPTVLADEMVTYDLDFQHRLAAGKRHNLTWGLQYRLVDDEVTNRTPFAGLVPSTRQMDLYSFFIQDEWSITDHFDLLVGSKVLYHFFSGLEVQPTARIAWKFGNNNTLWAAASRAVRAPSRFDVDYFLPIERQPPNVPSVAGGPDFRSEKLYGYELGLRSAPGRKLNLSLATFYNHYRDVYSVELQEGTLTYYIRNGSEAETWGFELSSQFNISRRWQIKGGYTYIDKDLRPKKGHTHNPSYLANDARGHGVLRSLLNISDDISLDITARYVDYIPASFATISVPAYFTFDTRLAWTFDEFEFTIVGQNLWSDRHTEFGNLSIPRSVYGKLSWRY